MAALYTAKITDEMRYGVKLYSVHFYKYTSEDSTQDEGYIHGLIDLAEAQMMKCFWETGGAKVAIMFMHANTGTDYAPEDCGAIGG